MEYDKIVWCGGLPGQMTLLTVRYKWNKVMRMHNITTLSWRTWPYGQMSILGYNLPD